MRVCICTSKLLKKIYKLKRIYNKNSNKRKEPKMNTVNYLPHKVQHF